MYGTHFFERQILNTFRGITAEGYPNLFLALFHTDPTNAGNMGTEITYAGYERQPIDFTAPVPESGGIGTRNVADLLWEVSPTDVGVVRHIGLFDALTGGNMLVYGELQVPLEIRAGQQPSIYAGDVLFFLVGDTSDYFKTAIFNLWRDIPITGFLPHWALFDGEPTGTGVELSGASYARPPITFGEPEVQVGDYTSIANTALVRFPSPTSTWGMWVWDAVVDAPVGGNIIFKFQHPQPEELLQNYVPQSNIGEFELAVN